MCDRGPSHMETLRASLKAGRRVEISWLTGGPGAGGDRIASLEGERGERWQPFIVTDDEVRELVEIGAVEICSGKPGDTRLDPSVSSRPS